MVSKPPAVSADFQRFIARLGRSLRPVRVILFGSRARGTHRPTSDYDILVIARRFRRVPWARRAGLVLSLWDLPLDLEPICLTPEEFRHRKGEISIVGEASREGRVIYP